MRFIKKMFIRFGEIRLIECLLRQAVNAIQGYLFQPLDLLPQSYIFIYGVDGKLPKEQISF